MRSAIHLTGRFRRRAASAASAYSRYMNVLVPNPPPTSGVITRTLSGLTFSTWFASVSRRLWTPWLEMASVKISAASSKLATTPRVSISW